MPLKRDPLKLLRIVAALAIIVYSYDILHCLVILIYPTTLGAEYAPYYTGALAATDAAFWLRLYVLVTAIIAIVVSLLEVRGGLSGLKGHITRGESWFCLAVATYCAFCLVASSLSGRLSAETIVEYTVSGIVAFLLWYYGKTVLARAKTKLDIQAGGGSAGETPGQAAQTKALSQVHGPEATKEDYASGLKVVGALSMLFSVYNLAQSIIFIANPSLIYDDYIEAGAAMPTWTDVVGSLAVNVMFALVLFYIGYVAFKKQPTKASSRVSFAIFTLLAVGMLFKIMQSGLTSLDDFAQVSCAGVSLLYWIYYRKLHA